MQIEPRSFDQILSEGTRLLGRSFTKLLAPAFVSSILLAFATAALFRRPGATDFMDMAIDQPQALQDLEPAALVELARPFFQASFYSLIAYLVVSGFIAMVTHRIVVSDVSGREESAKIAIMTTLGRLPSLLVAGSVAVLGVVAGFFLLVIPAVVIGVYLSMIAAVIAIEDATPTQALRRSVQLVSGRWLPTFGFLFVVGFLGALAGQLIQVIAIPLLANGSISIGLGLAFALGALVQGLVIAAIAVMATVWYLDLRARKEMFISDDLV